LRAAECLRKAGEVTVESWVMVMFLVHRREPWCGRSFGTPGRVPAVFGSASS
jgi:hypothetical protein